MAMVNISQEKPHEIESRLRRVIQETRLTVYDDPFAFEEFSLTAFKERADLAALALVRDDEVWSQLVKAVPNSPEPFAIWRFHFSHGADNSGFVGWLATHLKKCFGTGVFVICGQNSNDGGIFDYWGCPWELRESVLDEVSALVEGNS
jgi:Family of unknown function (DUF6196)